MAKDHISSFPTVTSHYCRSKSDKRYIVGDITSWAEMYRLYKIWHNNLSNGNQPIGDKTYQNLRVQEFKNLSLNKNRQDTCKKCDNFKKQHEECSFEDKRKIEIQRDLHHARAARGYQIPKEIVEKDDANSMIVCLDLKQALVTPKLTSGICYYKRKVSKCPIFLYL